MSASLVGSEMCIRDRPRRAKKPTSFNSQPTGGHPRMRPAFHETLKPLANGLGAALGPRLD
eukprot:6381910-Alexandrium_andersonii.AAC.1